MKKHLYLIVLTISILSCNENKPSQLIQQKSVFKNKFAKPKLEEPPASILIENPINSIYEEINFTDHRCYLYGEKFFEKEFPANHQLKISIEAICTQKELYDTMPYFRGGINGAQVDKYNDNYASITISNKNHSRKINIYKSSFKDSIQEGHLISNGQFKYPFKIVSISKDNTVKMISEIHFPFSDAGTAVVFEVKENNSINILGTEEFYEY
jgi:hypothetical protein